MSNLVIPRQVIGLMGGGVLARNLAIAAQKLGFVVGLFSEEEECAAKEVASWQMVGQLDDINKLRTFAEKCDIVLYTTKNISDEILTELEALNKLPQGEIMAEMINDRVKERAFLEESNVNIAPYKVVHLMIDVYDAVDYLGYPCVVKTARNDLLNEEVYVLEQEADLGKCLSLLEKGPCIIEALIPKSKEITVVAAFNGTQKPTLLPLAEKIRISNDLSGYTGPLELPDEMMREIYRIAEILTLTLQAQGVLEIELFVNDLGIIYVNTLSVLPTTALHFTEYTGASSVYTALIKGVCGWPIMNEVSAGKWLTVDIHKKEYANVLGQIPFQPDWQLSFYANQSNQDVLRGTLALPYTNLTAAISQIISSQAWNV